ncbi:MAG: hypothetical protein J6Y54_01970, partial [Lentisphaeria bacterium]|nr:hypothetical protein [Lentisphaeria bacterium]
MKKIIVRFWTGCAAVLSPLCAVAAPVMSARMDPSNAHGVQLFADRIKISKAGRVAVVAPEWKSVYLRNKQFYGSQKIGFEKLPDGFIQKIVDTGASATLDEYSVRCHGSSAVITVAVTMRKDRPAVLEHVAMVLNNRILENARYEITLPDGSRRTGVIPEAERKNKSTALLPEFKSGTFRGNAGTLTIEVLSGPPVKMDDRRSIQYSIYAKSFLVWSASVPMPKPGKTLRQVIRVTFDAPEPAASAATSVVIPKSRAGSLGMRPRPLPALFPPLPRPRNIRFTGKCYKVSKGDALMISNASERLLRHARKFAEKWGLELAKDGEIGCEMRGVFVTVGDRPDDESYTIRVDADGVTVNAKGERGAFYALQTLRGWWQDGEFNGVEINDAPAFPIRAIHANADSDALEHLGNLTEKLFAPLKINTIILECPFVKWDALEGQHHVQGMSKEDLRKLLAIAEENYIRVWPLLPTYSHSEWFFWNGKDLDMLDDPKDRRSYNSLHPGVRSKLTRLFEEILAAFGNPEYFHISHDELLGAHPVRPEGRKVGIAKLFYDDTMWHYDFFKKRGVKLMMWHDMLVSKQETNPASVANGRKGTELLRKKLPRDITICCWNYLDRMNGTYPEVDRFREDGFPVFGAGWFNPGNLEALSSYCRKKGALGMIETTWHGKVGSGGLLQTQYPQLTAYVRAAALFWNPDNGVVADPEQRYFDLMRGPQPEPGELFAVPVKCNFLIDGTGDDFEKLPETVTTPDGVAFRLARKNGRIAAAGVASAAHPELPAKVRIPIKSKCRALHLLHTVLNKTLREDGVTVKLVFRYADGSFVPVYPRNAIDISYGSVPVFKDDGKVVKRVFEVATPRENFSFFRNRRNAVEWTNGRGEPRCLWAMRWDNPFPEKAVDHLLIEAKDRGTVYGLLALTMEK